MATIYFLVFVVVCVFAVVWLMSRSGKQREKREASTRRQAAHHTQPLYQHGTAGHSLLHSHAGHATSAAHDIWHTRRPRATEERWEKTGSLTARRIRSDADPDETADDEMTMSAIEYTPEPERMKRPTGTKR